MKSTVSDSSECAGWDGEWGLGLQAEVFDASGCRVWEGVDVAVDRKIYKRVTS